jgi:hypothetical protein
VEDVHAAGKFTVPGLVAAALVWTLAGCGTMSGPGTEKGIRPELLGIVVTEINYHPYSEGDIDGDDFEFIEIKNTGSADIGLNDVAFTDGIHFDFSATSVLKSDSFLVLASNNTRFFARYGFSPLGVYTGKLSNSGEEISLKDMLADKKILSVTYDAKSPWPKDADGGGMSLQRINLYEKDNGHANWTSGAPSPGK